MHKGCKTQRKFLQRVPYDCKSCPWTKYPHLASILDDEPNKPKYWVLANNSYCDISFHGVADRPLMVGDFDPKTTFSVNMGNVNTSACLQQHLA